MVAAPTTHSDAMHIAHVRSILQLHRQNGIKIVKFAESMDAPGYEYIWRHYGAAAADRARRCLRTTQPLSLERRPAPSWGRP